MSGSEVIAEDVTQDVFITLLRGKEAHGGGALDRDPKLIFGGIAGIAIKRPRVLSKINNG